MRNTSDEGNGTWRKEADARIRQAGAQQCRYQHQLVVVDPDGVAGPVFLRHGVGERLIGLAVGIPTGGVDGDAVEQVVEQRPQHAVGEPVVIALDVVG
jgi:hypothetical protein